MVPGLYSLQNSASPLQDPVEELKKLVLMVFMQVPLLDLEILYMLMEQSEEIISLRCLKITVLSIIHLYLPVLYSVN